MNTLIQSIEIEENADYTENGAITNKSTLDNLLDFYGLGGALRSRDEKDIQKLFRKAFAQDKLLALKCLFYFRNCRGGQGERRTFRVILNWLGDNYPELVEKNLENIVFFGRWDDVYALENTEVWGSVLNFIKKEWNNGMSKNSLIYKWLPSVNTSSKETRRKAKELVNFLGLTEKQYRKTLSHKREQLNIVESKMCAKQWNDIDYSHVPSKASLNYKEAFAKHDKTRYQQFLKDVESGAKKINASTLYPYEIVSQVIRGNDSKTLDALWKALPNYISENPHNGIVVADVSGSMMGRPIEVSISLAMYFAERNNGAFKNTFITFSEYPSLVKIVGNNIREKVSNLSRADWGMNTNLTSVFDLILKTAIKYKVPQKDMPNTLYIVSDMEFDSACGHSTNYEVIRRKYEEEGYKQPNIVFWNVNARNNQAPITKNDKGTCLVSGCSPSILKSLLNGKAMSPVDVMMETLNSPEYDRIVV
jgi:hypothetical protein